MPRTKRDSRPPERSPAREADKTVDTVLLIERAFAPREVSRRTALWVLVGVSLVTAAVTFAVRRSASPDPDRDERAFESRP